MATITLPSSPGKTDETFTIQRLDFALRMMTAGSVAYLTPHYWWSYTFRLPPQKFDTARLWASRLNQLSSFANTFQASPPGYSGPSTGYSGAAPKVKGASQTGTSLACDGVSTSTAIASEGDYISFNGELHQLAADATSDGFSDVTFTLCEPMRSSPADNADVELDAPVATFRLADASHQYTADYLSLYGIIVNAVEFYVP